jgi:hypothetical protein
VPDKLKSSNIVVKLSEPLMNKGRTLWVDNYHNSPSLCVLPRDNGVSVAGTLRLNRTHVPDSVKNKKLKKAEATASECSGVVVMKWRDKRDVSFVSTFHDNTVVTKTMRGNEIIKPKCITEYNSSMWGVDKTDQMIQPFNHTS